MKHYPHVYRFVTETPWAILPMKLATIMEIITMRVEGIELSAEEIQHRIGSATRPGPGGAGAVAVLPLWGVLAQRMNLMTQASGGTSTEQFSAAFRQVMQDSTVKAVVLAVDSPGGSVFGVDELASEVYRARGQKPIVAVADSLAASAAYWIASAADEIVMTPGGQVGSIGVLAAHEDLSRMLDAAGVTTTLISAGRFKTEGNPYEPLTSEARSAIQSQVDDYYAMFTRAVARNRGVSVEQVRSGYGEGRLVNARQAMAAGMVDRVGTLRETVDRLARGSRQGLVGANGAVSTDFRRRRLRSLAR